MDKIEHNDQIIVPATKIDQHGDNNQGRLVIDFTIHGEPMFSWQAEPPASPTVEDELGLHPEGPYRWTAFHAHSYKRYFVLLVLIEPPYGSWWLGTAATLEQAENIFFEWQRLKPSLGPSSSLGAYGV